MKREVALLMETKNTEASEAQSLQSEINVIAIRRSNYWSYAAAAAIFIGALGFAGHTFYNQQIEAQNLVTQKEVRNAVNQKIQQATFLISNPFEHNQVEVAEADKCFHIVAGSFRSQRNVTNLMKRMLQLGYNPKTISKDSIGVSQVLFGSYATFSSAQNELEKIQIKENPEAWILIKKL
jgi:hypothetical protein